MAIVCVVATSVVATLSATVATIKIHTFALSCVVSHLFAFDPIKACYYLDIADAVIVIENMLNLDGGS